MKKIVALVAVLFSVVVPFQSQAAAAERIVIIDNAFNLTQVSGSVEFVCVASDRCTNKTVSNKDHGTQMALVARQQNPSATLVLIQAAPVSKKGIATDVNLIGFIDALTFVNNNSNSVSAVSFSRYMNASGKLTGQCFPPATYPYTPQTGFDKVKSSVISLNQRGIQVYAAAGNNAAKPIDFPACVSEVVSVGSYLYAGAKVDILATLVTPENLSTIKGLLPNGETIDFSTSTATVALAANSKSISVGSCCKNSL